MRVRAGVGAATAVETASASCITRAPKAGENLAANGIVPIAERRTRHVTRCRPRASAQHLVLGPEEHLGVLRVRECPEAGMSREVAVRPLPDVAHHSVTPHSPHFPPICTYTPRANS